MNIRKVVQVTFVAMLCVVSGLSFWSANAIHAMHIAPSDHLYGAAVPIPPPTGTATTVLTYPGTFPVDWSTLPAGFTAGGDLGGTSTSQTVLQIHGSTVPAGGSLTIGNALQVTGAGALGYAPTNLAGGPNFVTGLFQQANAPPLSQLQTYPQYTGSYSGPFSSSNRFHAASGAVGPQIGLSRTIVLGFTLQSISTASDSVLVAYYDGSFGSGNGYWIEVKSNNALVLSLQDGAQIGFGLGGAALDLSIGDHVAVIVVDGSGNVRTSLDGGAIVINTGLTVTAVGSGGTTEIGAFTGSFPFSNGGIYAWKTYSRALSDAEAIFVSGQGADNRFPLLVPSGTDAAVDYYWRSDLDWSGSGGTSTPSVGGVALTASGTIPSVSVTEQLVRTQGQAYLDNSIIIHPAYQSDGSVDAHSCDARLVFQTYDPYIGIEGYSTTVGIGADITLGVKVDGVFTTALLWSTFASRQLQYVTLGGGNGLKTVEIIEGYQQTIGSGDTQYSGNFVRAIRTSPGGYLPVAPKSTAAALGCIGDSITDGYAGTPTTENGWPALLRAAWGGGSITLDAYGGRTLKQVSTTWTSTQAATRWLATVQNTTGPKYLIVNLGTNDYADSSWTPTAFGTYLQAVLTSAIAQDSTVVIYVQSPFPRTVETANGLGFTTGNYRTAVSNAVTAVASARVIFVDGTTIITTGSLSGDGVHPNAAGHVIIAAYYLPILGSVEQVVSGSVNTLGSAGVTLANITGATLTIPSGAVMTARARIMGRCTANGSSGYVVGDGYLWEGEFIATNIGGTVTFGSINVLVAATSLPAGHSFIAFSTPGATASGGVVQLNITPNTNPAGGATQIGNVTWRGQMWGSLD